MQYTTLLHLHMGFAILFLLTYSIKSILFLTGKTEAYLSFKKKTIIPETVFSVIFLVLGIWMMIFRFQTGTYDHWVDPKITMALAAIPVGIIGFKKENKMLVGFSWLLFLAALALGLTHFFNNL
jgi:uncharacterized membrane protein SirB2